MSIYVGNLFYKITPDDIHNVFTEYGTVTKISVPIDSETARRRGFAFVERENCLQSRQPYGNFQWCVQPR